MNEVHILYPEKIARINPDIYGHFSEHIGGVIYDGIWVGEDSDIPNIHGFRKELVELFRAIHPPVLRWPGGCFAETYDWRDGIGPREKRPTRVNWWYNRDKRTEPNEVGTHEFMEFCRLVGAKPYFAANATTLNPLAIRDWIEYCNFPQGSTTLAKEREANGDAEPFGIEYWGLGNENWGGGGNMIPEDYCGVYRKYAMVASSVGEDCKFIACGPDGNNLDWTRRFFDKWNDRTSNANRYANKLEGYSIHYYCGTAGEATEFTEKQWYELLKKAAYMENVVVEQRALMDSYDPERKVGIVVDEWGCWHKDGSGPSKGYNLFEQQSTMRDAVVAAMTLNIFNNHCDKVMMANVAQLVNNLHSLFLSQGDKLVATPNYYVFDMMKEHQGADGLRTVVETGSTQGVATVTASASVKDGKTLVTLVNTSYSDAAEVSVKLYGNTCGAEVERTVLTGKPDAYNTFEQPDLLVPVTDQIDAQGDSISLTLPAASVTCLRF